MFIWIINTVFLWYLWYRICIKYSLDLINLKCYNYLCYKIIFYICTLPTDKSSLRHWHAIILQYPYLLLHLSSSSSLFGQRVSESVFRLSSRFIIIFRQKGRVSFSRGRGRVSLIITRRVHRYTHQLSIMHTHTCLRRRWRDDGEKDDDVRFARFAWLLLLLSSLRSSS